MLYDLASEPPRPGSLLESVFILLAKRRQEADYYQTKVLMMASLAPHMEDNKGLQEALEQYRDAMFPFLEDEAKKTDRSSKEVLKQWTRHALKIRPLWRAKDNHALVSRLRKGAELVKKAETDRRQRKHRRI
jgi:hypothetical protein